MNPYYQDDYGWAAYHKSQITARQLIQEVLASK